MLKFINYLEVYYLYIISGLIIIIIALTGGLIYCWSLPQPEPIIKSNPLPITIKESKNTAYVDLKGAVKKPGVYLITNERLQDLIQKAGGLLKNADTSNVNLSQKLKDEMVIVINTRQEIKALDKVIKPVIKNDITPNSVTSTNQLININTADLNTLMTLNGIGESKAQDIINYRTKQLFTKIDDLKLVNGIGDATFDKIKSLITI